MSPPHLGHFTPSGTGLAFLHSGYALQERNSPYRPLRMNIGLPHLSQSAPASRCLAGLPSGPRSRLLLHSGSLAQPRNQPFFDQRLSITPPSSSHFWSVGSGSGFQRFSFLLLSSCWRNRL